MTTSNQEIASLSNEDRMTYDPGPSRPPKFRPTSAPRSFGNLRPHRPNSTENAISRVGSDGSNRPSEQFKRDRPTSAPVIREDIEYQAPGQQRQVKEPMEPAATEYLAEEQPPPFDIDKHTLDIIDELKTGKPRRSRPISAPDRHIGVLPPSAAMHRPLSAGIKRAKVSSKQNLQLPDSGALRFLRKSNNDAPPRIFAPSAAPQSTATRFTPTWALTHRAASASGMLSVEDSTASVRSDALSVSSTSRPLRPRTASSTRGRTPSPARRPPLGPAFPEVPRGAVQNPLATKVGKTELREVNGSFEPLKSQCQIPAYDGLYDPFLREFWSRKDVAGVMQLTGHVRPEWAPDSGLFEAAVSRELEALGLPRDVRDALQPPPAPNPVPVPELDPALPAGHVISIEVSEEAVSVANEYLPITLSQPVLSAWLHWGSLPGQAQAADLDLSAVCFDRKARAIEVVFFRHLVGKHEAVVHLGDDAGEDAPAGDAEEEEEGVDVASGARRREGIVVHLPRLAEEVQAVVLAVTCYSEEGGLAEAVGAEMRVSVGAREEHGLQTDLLRYYLSSERYNAAAPCMLVRDPSSGSGWSVRTTPRVTVANVVVEMMPVLQSMLRESGACMPYLVQVEYCTARRPSGSLRGRKADYTNSFKAVALAVRRIFPFIVVQGNPMEQPRVGAFEVTFVDGSKGRQLIWSKMKSGRWPKRMDTILNRITAAMQAVQVFYDIPDDRSVVEVSCVDAVNRTEIAFAVVEVHAMGLAAQKLQLESAGKGKKKGKNGGGAAPPGAGKRLYRVRSDRRGKLRMRLPGGRYEIWGLSEGYDCEYPLEISVRPFSKFKLHARLALAPQDEGDD